MRKKERETKGDEPALTLKSLFSGRNATRQGEIEPKTEKSRTLASFSKSIGTFRVFFCCLILFYSLGLLMIILIFLVEQD